MFKNITLCTNIDSKSMSLGRSFARVVCFPACSPRTTGCEFAGGEVSSNAFVQVESGKGKGKGEGGRQTPRSPGLTQTPRTPGGLYGNFLGAWQASTPAKSRQGSCP